MARFVEQPQTTTYRRNASYKEWPFKDPTLNCDRTIPPESRFFHAKTEIDRHPDPRQGDTFVYRAYGISRYRKTPRWEVWISLRHLVERAQRLMGRAR